MKLFTRNISSLNRNMKNSLNIHQTFISNAILRGHAVILADYEELA